MDFESANRLYEYRKEKKLSQEELADMIGVSRQAVSKWERGEASPDTDNLIALSKIYGITLDELIYGRKSNHTADLNVSEPVADVHNKERVRQKETSVFNVLKVLPYPLVCVMIHIFLGMMNLWGGWLFSWMVYLTIPLYYTLILAVEKRKAILFCYPVLTVMMFLIMGLAFELWYVGWIVFLTIPVYYSIAAAIDRNN